jgi:hypothetical protein
VISMSYNNGFSGGARWDVWSVAISDQFCEPSILEARV